MFSKDEAGADRVVPTPADGGPPARPVDLARERLAQGTAIVTSAIAADTKGDLKTAFNLYQRALEIIVSALKGWCFVAVSSWFLRDSCCCWVSQICLTLNAEQWNLK